MAPPALFAPGLAGDTASNHRLTATLGAFQISVDLLRIALRERLPESLTIIFTKHSPKE